MGLELKNVTKKFKTIEGERVVFENLNIHFPDYGLIAITGESGCGKSTLAKILVGSLPVSEKLDRPRREDTDRAPRGNRAERRRHSGKGRGGKPGKGKKPPTRKRR